VTVPAPACPEAAGSLHGSTLGPAHLGMTRQQVGDADPRNYTQGRRSETFLCLHPVGVRVGYASPKLALLVPKSSAPRSGGAPCGSLNGRGAASRPAAAPSTTSTSASETAGRAWAARARQRRPPPGTRPR
jgi:hypothetical protein